MATQKLNSREQLLAFVKSNGWSLDPRATITARRGWGEDKAKTFQDPHAFFKADGHGTWQVILDFKVRNDGYWSSGTRTDNRLRGVALRRFNSLGEEVNLIPESKRWRGGERIAPLLLENSDKASWRSTSWLWEVTGDYGTPIRKRVEKLLTNPALVVWLAAEAEWKLDEQLRNDAVAKRQERELRGRPLPEHWSTLARVAKVAVNADGLTDTEQVLIDLKAAIAAVEQAQAEGAVE